MSQYAFYYKESHHFHLTAYKKITKRAPQKAMTGDNCLSLKIAFHIRLLLELLIIIIYLVIEGLWGKLFVHNRQISCQTVHHFFKFLLLFVNWKEKRSSESIEINPFATTANCGSSEWSYLKNLKK